MIVPFDKTVTLYNRIETENSLTWEKHIVHGVYRFHQRRESISGNERNFINASSIIIPEACEVTLSPGDIIIDGICSLELKENDSGNALFKIGAWTVKTVNDNRYKNSAVSHIYGSEV